MAEWRQVTVPSFAKVNLDLRVLHRRADGFHEIRSLFHTISLADRVTLRWREARTLRVHTACPGLDISMEANLAHRAALAFCELAGARGELDIHIAKRIPHGGGLGGGSSNAATVLLALGELSGRGLPLPDLLRVAAALGSDVPFFLAGGAAYVTGRGEELYPAPNFPPLHGVLVAPGVAVSTPEAYRALARKAISDPGQTTESATLSGEFCAQVLAAEDALSRWDGRGLGRNDFEATVFAAHPSLKQWKRKVRMAGAIHAMMSGSGSSVFGLFASKQAADEAAQILRGPGNIRRFRLLPRRQYRQAWYRGLELDSNFHPWPPQPKRTATTSRG